jgi:peptide chain release factor 3
VQLFRDPHAVAATPILGAVGPLQFEVLQYRMQSEYDVELKLTKLGYTVARWPVAGFDPEMFRDSISARLVEDRERRPVLLFDKPWSLDWAQRRFPDLVLAETATDHRVAG